MLSIIFFIESFVKEKGFYKYFVLEKVKIERLKGKEYKINVIKLHIFS